MHLKKLTVVLITISALCGTSCRSPRPTLEKELSQNMVARDSVSEKITKEVKLLKTPQTTARKTLTPKQLEDLPVGGIYQARDGNVTATIEKKPDGSLEFTANCDSLTLIVEALSREVYHLNEEKTELKESLKEQKTEEVNRLTGWQWFQIYGFRIYVLLTIIIIIYRNIKNGKIKRLFQAVSGLAGGL